MKCRVLVVALCLSVLALVASDEPPTMQEAQHQVAAEHLVVPRPHSQAPEPSDQVGDEEEDDDAAQKIVNEPESEIHAPLPDGEQESEGQYHQEPQHYEAHQEPEHYQPPHEQQQEPQHYEPQHSGVGNEEDGNEEEHGGGYQEDDDDREGWSENRSEGERSDEESEGNSEDEQFGKGTCQVNPLNNELCGGPERGHCDEHGGVCICTEEDEFHGYFGESCECGFSQHECHPHYCYWCESVGQCVLDEVDCHELITDPEIAAGLAAQEGEADFDVDPSESSWSGSFWFFFFVLIVGAGGVAYFVFGARNRRGYGLLAGSGSEY